MIWSCTEIYGHFPGFSLLWSWSEVRSWRSLVVRPYLSLIVFFFVLFLFLLFFLASLWFISPRLQYHPLTLIVIDSCRAPQWDHQSMIHKPDTYHALITYPAERCINKRATNMNTRDFYLKPNDVLLICGKNADKKYEAMRAGRVYGHHRPPPDSTTALNTLHNILQI